MVIVGCLLKKYYLCTMISDSNYRIDDIYGERLLISKMADQTELADNIRVASTINGKLGDRKGVESENGIKSAFRKAKQQGCKVVVLDFDMHLSESVLKTKKIVSGLLGRHEDFTQGSLDECYVVHNSKAVVVKSEAFEAPDKESIKQIIQGVIEKLRT